LQYSLHAHCPSTANPTPPPIHVYRPDLGALPVQSRTPQTFPFFCTILECATMALSMLIALAACPALLGTQEAIRQSQSKSRKEEHRAARCNLMVTCVNPSTRSLELNNRSVVLRESKVRRSFSRELGINPQAAPVRINSRSDI
jgi:hypothetical protein